jgi:hypothetical protein
MEIEDDEQQEDQLDEDAGNDNGAADEAQGEDQGEESGEILTVQIGDEEPEDAETEGAPEWVKDLRKSSREKDKRIRELEAQVSKPAAAEELGAKPTLQECDYDEAEYDRLTDEWKAKKARIEAQAEQQQQQQVKAEERWNTRVASYTEGRAKIGVQDYDDAEAAVKEELAKGTNPTGLNDLRFNILVNVAPDPNIMVYALAKNPKRLEELRSIEDLSEYAFKLGQLSTEIKVGRKTPPPPEGRIRGTGGTNAAVDNTLEKLREEARKTGDMTKVLAYKRSKAA